MAETLRSAPGMNQAAIVRKLRDHGFAKGDIEKCLKNGSFTRESGPHNSILYSLRNDPEVQC